jgi:hypothetical protein
VNRRARKTKAPIRRASLRPPPFDATIVVAKRFRFSSPAAQVRQGYVTADLTQLLGVAQSAIAGISILGGIRILSLEIWGPMASDLKPVTAAIEYVSLPSATAVVGGPSKIHSDTSMGSMACAHIRAAPPGNCLAGLWVSKVNAELFLLTCPANSIVDLSVEFVLANGTPLDNTSILIAGATAGDVFVNTLEGGQLVPVSLIDN